MEDLSQSALIVVDFQNDFCPGGALAVPEGDLIYPVVQDLIDRFEEAGRPIIFTRDFHPQNHISFVSQGGPWPAHCVQNSLGFEFYPRLRIPQNAVHFYKGYLDNVDAYSGFEGRLVEAGRITETTLESWLKAHNVKTVFIVGLATDYCVRATTLDALHAEFQTIVVSNGIKGVNVQPDDSDKAIHDMQGEGAVFLEWPVKNG
ncbi:nicotinamidase/pyrazinamidase [Sulfobacillus thermosulfidooxidans DSM 9293]|uniref:nicotinamidase n=1 Tax=Sulfobacillus thermosulfidooxidans (strain DSM 9293 / VKM B-1269 / AT-1) TaxID=929705 RepID=A0A1W1W787_SULTA|nr:bifunctional nicotinamidase/pyrazinamidase [Sulfobacillus thermosulfidooxidans]SMC02138.1 nicotinamidase/pyrazinamidase [Sulfobacillus thermosulfidooxidans DSM 9293]